MKSDITDADKQRLYDRAAFDAGARAMRNAAADVVHRWWNRAPAGHRHPGHPHHLEVKVRSVKVEHLDGRP